MAIRVFLLATFLLAAFAACRSAPTPPVISPVSSSVVNMTFLPSGGGPYPGHLWYNLPNNQVNQQWLQSPKDVRSEVQLDWNNGSISGVMLFIDVNPTNNHTTCGVIKLYEGPYSVDMWGWLQEGAHYNGTETVNGVLCDVWWGSPDSMQLFHLYVQKGTNTPIRFVNEGDGDIIVTDFLSYTTNAPPPSVFAIPKQCVIDISLAAQKTRG